MSCQSGLLEVLHERYSKKIVVLWDLAMGPFSLFPGITEFNLDKKNHIYKYNLFPV